MDVQCRMRQPESSVGDFRRSEVFAAELAEIKARRAHQQVCSKGKISEVAPEPVEDTLVGLAFSGGGVRSATFCLGVAQALVKSNLFSCFDYLSTVSGGGYAGCTLTSSLMSSDPASAKPLVPPISYSGEDEEGGGESQILQHLRNHSKYLAPTGKGSTLHILALVLLGLTTNLLLITPALIGISFLVLAALTVTFSHTSFWMAVTFACWTAVYALMVSSARLVDSPMFGRPRWLSRTVHVLGFLGALAFLQLQPSALEFVEQIISWLETNDLGRLVQLLLGSVGAAAVLLGAIGSLIERYKRTAGRIGRIALGLIGPLALWAIVLTMLATLTQPCTWYTLELHSGIHIENAAIRQWLTNTSVPHPRFHQSCAVMTMAQKDQPTRDFYAPVAGEPGLGSTTEDGSTVKDILVYQEDLGVILLLYSLLALGLSLLGVFINVNATSLHAFYRDRLRDAYIQAQSPNKKVKLSDLPDAGPYHLLNAAINIQDSERNLRGRNADSFFFSKHFCGSASTGWCRTTKLEAVDPEIDLAAAMAISGAAVAPNQGVATSRTLRFLLALANARLGYWMVNPNELLGALGKASRRVTPYYFFLELLGKLDEKKSRVYLSDGGHIENLGAYELLRRRCRFIVIVDAEQDNANSFHGLAHLMRLAKIDFGYDIEFTWVTFVAMRAASQRRMLRSAT